MCSYSPEFPSCRPSSSPGLAGLGPPLTRLNMEGRPNWAGLIGRHRESVTQGSLSAQKLVCKHLLHWMQHAPSNSGEVGKWVSGQQSGP